MSNLNFKNPFEMSHDELLSYIGDLEKRIANANNGAAIFRSEANLNRTEMLKYKEIAGQAEDRMVEQQLTFARHLEALSSIAYSSYEAAAEESDFRAYVRLLKFMLRQVLQNFRMEYMREQPEPADDPSWDDIPF